jgi:signal peptidase I
VTDATDAADGRRKSRGALRETVFVVVGALLVAVLIRTFLVQAFFIPSQSMENTLAVGDRVLVSKLSTSLGTIHRGDVVVFRDPSNWITPIELPQSTASRWVHDALTFVGLLPSDSGDDLVKRVIGVGGDRVVCCDDAGRITVNGVPITEPYLYPGNVPSQSPFDVLVPPGKLWVMGDHRSVSQDSRFHEAQQAGDGMVPESSVIGRALLVVWPFSHWAVLSNPGVFADVPASGNAAVPTASPTPAGTP